MDSETLGLTAEDFDPSGALRALNKLQKVFVPTLRRATPFWHPKAPPIWRKVHEPDWDFTGPDSEQYGPQERTMLDCNGAFLAPLSGTEMAHGELAHSGALPAPGMTSKQVLPGYYLVHAAHWGDTRIVSPLGQGKMAAQIWIAAPTLALLLELHEAGHWPPVTIYDSWTCEAKMRMSKWAAWLREVRLFAMDTDAQWVAEGAEPSAVDAVKDGYSMAFQLMIQQSEPGKPRRSSVFRPDWYHAVRSQHRANMWRKAWKAVNAGIPILTMGTVDELEIPTDIVQQLIDMPEPPLRIDLTGRQLGAFKVKR